MTSYELQTALAMLYFAESRVEYAVLEVGMGGRLDSTNVVTPIVSVISSISYDHTFILGETLSEIAGEKGGIIKPGVPVVSAPQQPEALKILEQLAEEKGSEFILVGKDLVFKPLSHSLGGQSFEVSQIGESKMFETRLLGGHQIENAVTALAALTSARSTGLVLGDKTIQEGFKQVVWPGRFEVVSREPAVVFDGAHNRDSAKRLMQTIKEYFPGQPLTLVFGAMEDKDIKGMFFELLPSCTHLLLTSADHPRAAKIESLEELAEGYACSTELVNEPEQVLPRALALTSESGVVFVTGSLSVVGDFRSLWYQNMKEDRYN